jgi:hypothetical protein
MSKIDLEMATGIESDAVTADNTSANLLAEIGDEMSGWVVAELPYMRADGYPDNNTLLQAVYSEEAGRAGLVVVGSGANGHTEWTDATSLAEAFARYLTDTMAP